MGLFTKREYKEDPAPSDSQLDPNREVLRLRNELRKINASLKEAKDQLQHVRDEYTTTVSDIMKIKKEINSKRETQRKLLMQNRNIEVQIEQGRKILQSSHKDLDLVKKTSTDLSRLEDEIKHKKLARAKIHAEIKSARDELGELNADLQRRRTQSSLLNQELARLAVELDQSRAHIPKDQASNALKNLAVYKSRLVEANAENHKLRIELESSTTMIQELRDRIESVERRRSTSRTSSQQSNRRIIETASSLVASYKSKLTVAKEELAGARRTSVALQNKLEKIKKENALLKMSLRGHDV